MTKNIDLRGLDRDTLLMVAVRACDRLCAIGNMLTTDEGDPDDTEEEFGLPVSEIVEMAHDNMILEARRTVESIFREVSASPPIGAEGGRDGSAGVSGCGEGTQEPSPSGAQSDDGRGTR